MRPWLIACAITCSLVCACGTTSRERVEVRRGETARFGKVSITPGQILAYGWSIPIPDTAQTIGVRTDVTRGDGVLHIHFEPGNQRMAIGVDNDRLMMPDETEQKLPAQ